MAIPFILMGIEVLCRLLIEIEIMAEVSKFSASTLKSLVGVDGELKSLNDLWKFAGSPKSKEPKRWVLLPDPKAYIASEMKTEKDGKSVLLSKKGRNGGIYGSNRILLEYARYLDKGLAVIVNEVFLQEVAAQQNPDLYLDKFRKAYKKKGKDDAWISERMKGVGARKELTSTLKTHGVTEGHEFRECTNASYTGLFGMNAPAIREGLGISKKQSIRDNMNQTELMALSLSENLAKKDIEKRSLWGVKSCSLSCHDAAKTISEAVQGFLNR